MGTDLATQTGSLELAPNSSEANLLASVSDERDLTKEQFLTVSRIADAPPPALVSATDDDVRAIIGSLAGILKAPRISLGQGRLQLGLYRKALTGIPKAALAYAGDRALRELEWMPTPAELLKLAQDYLSPSTALHNRARRLTRDRRQRIFQERCRALLDRTFPADQLHTLTDQEIRIGLSEGALSQAEDGSLAYLPTQQGKGEALQTDERDNRALACSRCQGVGEVMELDGSVVPCGCGGVSDGGA